jgi:hypothetical protein
MNVLISWVGPSGRQVARALRDWLPEVVSSVKPDVIEEDVLSYSSVDWKQNLVARVYASAACVVCITPEAAESHEPYFQLGLIAGMKLDGPLYPFFAGTDEKPILSFVRYGLRCTVAQKESVLSFVSDLNRRIGQPPLPEPFLLGVFSAKWPALRDTLQAIAAAAKLDSDVQRSLPPAVLRTMLSDAAMELLLGATTDPNGVVTSVSTFAGWHLQTNGKEFVEPNNPLSEAKWLAALRELMKEELLEPRGSKGEIYAVTPKGRRLADMIRTELE